MTILNEYFKKHYHITPSGATHYRDVGIASSLFTRAGVLCAVADCGEDGATLHELEHLTGERRSYIKSALEDAIKNGYIVLK